MRVLHICKCSIRVEARIYVDIKCKQSRVNAHHFYPGPLCPWLQCVFKRSANSKVASELTFYVEHIAR